MATQVQFRRGTTSQNNAFTGAQGELTIDTDVYTIRIHDGTTAGGKQVPTLTATQTFTNKTMSTSSVWNGNAIGLGYGGTGAALSGVAGAVVYSTGSAMALSLAGTSGQVLTSGGTSGPTWVSASALSTGTATTATTATNIAGGSAGYLVYQQDTNTTGFIAPGTSGYVLRSTGASTAPSWVTSALTIGSTAAQVGDTTTSFAGVTSITMGNGSYGNATVGSITGTGPWTATLTGITSTTGINVGQYITATAGTGTLFGGTPTSVVVASIVSGTSITYTVTGGTIPTNGTVTSLTTLGYLQVPSGTTAQRPYSPANGMIRYNSTQSTFEGYSSSAWSSLGGVKSVDALTYIIAETSAGASNGDLDFYAEDAAGTAATQVGQWNRTNLKDYTGTLVGTQTTQNVFNATATTVNAFGAATTLAIGNATSATLTLRPGTVVGSNTTQNLYNTVATTGNLFGAGTTIGVGATTGTLTLNNPTVVGSQTTVNLWNTTSTTVNAFGASTATTLGASTGTFTVNSVTLAHPNATSFTMNGASPSLTTTSTGTVSVFNTNALTGALFGAATAVSIGASTGTLTLANPTITATNATSLALNGASPAITTTSTTASVFNSTVTTLNIGGAATTVSIGAATGTATINNANVVITGNLTVNGTTTTVNSTTLTVDDINIELGSVASPTDITAAGGGITLKGATDKTISWGATNGWTSSEDINVASGKIYRINGTSVLSSTTLGSGVTGSSLTSVGTIGTGVWQGTIVGPTYGGTGVNNGSSTLTLAGNVTHAGLFTQSFTATANTAVTLPTTGTLATLAGTETFTNKTLTSPTLTTPSLGVATATSINGLTITSSTGTLTVTNAKTLSVSNTLTFTGTDSSSVAFGAGGTVLYSGGALGTPSSGTLTNATGLPISTGVSGLGTGVATFLGTPSSANLLSAITDETGTGVLVFGTAPTISLPVINNIKTGYTTTATAAGSTTLTVNSNYCNVFTGTTTQTIVLPVTSTLTAGMAYEIENNSTGNLTVNSSGGNLVATVLPGTTAHIMCIGTTLTTAADWDADFTAWTSTASVQHGSLGIGTAASGTAGEILATNSITSWYSDDRLKTRVGNIENALEKVLSLDGFHYYANETAVALGYDGAKQEVGLSAQQVQKVLPEVIAPAPIDAQYMTMHYERLVPLLVEAIKEQQKQIEELKAKLGN